MRVWSALQSRPTRAVLVSIAIHAMVVAIALLGVVPGQRYSVKRGEPLFVELPELPEPAPAGNPAARSLGPAAPAAEAPTRQQPPRAEPRVAPPASRPPIVASRPAPIEPPPARPTPPPTPDGEATVRQPEPPPPSVQPSPPSPPSPPPVAEPGPATPPAAAPRVAAIPPSKDAAPVDIRSALGRQGGAGSVRGGGRGGIEGEPVPLDSQDPDFRDYLDKIRRKVKENWGYPCIKTPDARHCDYKTASLVVEFGILRDGNVQFVDVHRSSGYEIYDDYAVNAIKLASPFPTVPPALMRTMKPGSKGLLIVATFNYIVDTSLTNILR